MINPKQVIEGANRMNTILQQINDNEKQIQEVFNDNFQALFKRLDRIEEHMGIKNAEE